MDFIYIDININFVNYELICRNKVDRLHCSKESRTKKLLLQL